MCKQSLALASLCLLRTPERSYTYGMSNEQLERGLQASVKIYHLAVDKLGNLPAGTEGLMLSREELVSIKKASAAMNRALTALVRESHDTENRLTLELHMLRDIMQREHTDRDANRARVYDLFRRYTNNGGDETALPSSTGSSNPLNAPSATAMAVDRALASLERIEQSMNDLSPIGRVSVHGAGLLSAKTRMEETASRESKTKRPKA